MLKGRPQLSWKLTIMNSTTGHRFTLIKLGKILAFAGAILATTALTQEFGTLNSAPTAAFSFLILVVLSAFFADLLVAITTSIVATLCFDYFYLPPFGTFNITALSDWISLAAFLLASVIISRLTASAAEHAAKAKLMNETLLQLKEFGEWLSSLPHDQLTLSRIAQEALRVFALEYCSIHVYGEGKWQHFTGAAAANLSQEVETRLNLAQDHPTDFLEFTSENDLGVEYVQINKGTSPSGWLVVKGRNLPGNAIGILASMIGVRLRDKSIATTTASNAT